MATITTMPIAGRKEILVGEALAIANDRSSVRATKAHLVALIEHYRELQTLKLVPCESEDEYDTRQWRTWREADRRSEEESFRRMAEMEGRE